MSDINLSRAALPAADATPGLVDALDILERNISYLDEGIGYLYQRISPILRPEGDTAPSDPNAMAPHISDVAERIYRQAATVDRMKRALQLLMERIDL